MKKLRTLAYKIAVSMCKHHENAEDLCHDALILYLENKTQVKNVQGWLYTTIKHKQQEKVRHLQMTYRKQKMIKNYLYENKREDQKQNTQKIKTIFEHISTLPLLDQEIIYQVIEGNKQKVIANSLNITLPSLKNRLFRIRKGIKTIII